MIVVIDGPSGSGKSSTAKAVADRTGLQYIDSGAIYRVAALIYLQAGKNHKMFFDLLDRSDIQFRYENGIFRVWLDREEMTGKIRRPEISDAVSTVAAMPEVRKKVNEYLRDSVRSGRFIADGRDLGTVVYPDADLKIFMTADLDKRARRRWNELKEMNVDVDLEKVKANLAERDKIDSGRQAAPLRKADDAIEMDTSSLNFNQQVDRIIQMIKAYTVDSQI